MENKKECGCKDNKKREVKMSTPEGKEFNTPYTMDTTIYNELYWDTTRNMGSDFDVDVNDEQPYILPFDQHLDNVIDQISGLLKSKNKAYGNTALNPTNVFSKLNAKEAICARIDDKIARIKNKGINDKTEDTVDDLIGYLLLLKMSM